MTNETQGKVAEIQALPGSDVYLAMESRVLGLTQAEAQERLARYGRNVLQEIKGKPLYLKFLANFTH
jgi:magnesium-transporting ATPase (P-type)